MRPLPLPPLRTVAYHESAPMTARMHVRGCTCEECLPGVPAVSTWVRRRGQLYASVKARKAAQNKRAYLRRTGLGHLAG